MNYTDVEKIKITYGELLIYKNGHRAYYKSTTYKALSEYDNAFLLKEDLLEKAKEEAKSHLWNKEKIYSKHLYLCGAISNNPNYKDDFNTAYSKLQNAGYEVTNPLHICNGDDSWDVSMRKCLQALPYHKRLALIESKYKSKGRDLELQNAKALGIEIHTIAEWLKMAKEKK